MNDIGKRIRDLRESLGMTQEELAHKVGYKSRVSINKIELQRDIPIKKVVPIAKALDVDPSVLMGWDDTPQYTNPENDDTLEFIKIDENGQISIKAKSTESLKYMVDLVDDISEENKKKIKDFIEKIYAIEQMEKEVE